MIRIAMNVLFWYFVKTYLLFDWWAFLKNSAYVKEWSIVRKSYISTHKSFYCIWRKIILITFLGKRVDLHSLVTPKPKPEFGEKNHAPTWGLFFVWMFKLFPLKTNKTFVRSFIRWFLFSFGDWNNFWEKTFWQQKKKAKKIK